MIVSVGGVACVIKSRMLKNGVELMHDTSLDEKEKIAQRVRSLGDDIFHYVNDIYLVREDVSYRMIVAALKVVAEHIEKELQVVAPPTDDNAEVKRER
jgi:hypothetical protein